MCCSGDHQHPECKKEHVYCTKCGTEMHHMKVCLKSRMNFKVNTRSMTKKNSPEAMPSAMPKKGAAKTAAVAHFAIIHSIPGERNKPTPKIYVSFCPRVMRHQFDFAITPDTGAMRTMIGLKTLLCHRVEFDSHHHERIFTANSQDMSCEETV